MTINSNRQDDTLTVIPEGRLDTLSAPELEEFLGKYYASVSKIIFDFEKLDYVSSAGLRVLLIAHKAMSGKGGVVIRNANTLIKSVFNVTGFGGVFRFE